MLTSYLFSLPSPSHTSSEKNKHFILLFFLRVNDLILLYAKSSFFPRLHCALFLTPGPLGLLEGKMLIENGKYLHMLFQTSTPLYNIASGNYTIQKEADGETIS